MLSDERQNRHCEGAARLTQFRDFIKKRWIAASALWPPRNDKQHILNRFLDKLHMREYDLPLHKSEDSRFLVLLVGLMIIWPPIALWLPSLGN